MDDEGHPRSRSGLGQFHEQSLMSWGADILAAQKSAHRANPGRKTVLVQIVRDP